VTFLAAWFTLDRLATAPPMPVTALAALGAAAAILVAGSAIVDGGPPRKFGADLGLGRPTGRSIVAALIVGGALLATFVAGAAAEGVHLNLRPNWPAVLAGAFLFHGAAEELVWRGFAFGWLRRGAPFRMAVLRSVPLIALTHVPIIIGNGALVGTIAVITAAATCLPLSYLWERGGRTIWAPAILHGFVGTWQLFERSYPIKFQLVILAASIVVPLAAFLFGDRYFSPAKPRLPHSSPVSVNLPGAHQ
jgi:hypothetical protein